MENFSDTDLLIAEDSHTAFTIIYNRYWDRLYKKALVRFGDDADAQDTVQEVFISLWRNKLTIDAPHTLAPYLFAALKFAIIKKVYQNAKLGKFTALSIDRLEEYCLSGEDQFQVKELQSVILHELDNLPVKMRRIYDLSRVENMRTAEIAEQLNISEQTVKNTLTTALKRLRNRLTHYANFFL